MKYVQIPAADAIADLCLPTGNDRLDIIQAAIIDLVQRGYLYPVRTAGNPVISYFPTKTGKQYVTDHYQQALEITDDN